MMKTTKFLLFAFFVFANCYSSQAQYFNSYWIRPTNPTTNDSVFLIDSADLAYISMRIYYDRVDLNNNFFTINQCYNHAGGLAEPSSTSQITPLGKLASGTYSGIIYSHSQYITSDTDCSQYGIRDSLTFSFTVTAPLGLNANIVDHLNFYPNPVRNKLYSDYSLYDIAITITDMTGSAMTLPITDREIDVASLPSGIYCIRLQTTDGIIVRRFLKE